MSQLPFVLSLDTPTYYGHDLFPNRMYRRLHARHTDSLDMHTLGLIARLGAHGHHLAAKDMSPLPNTGKHGFEVNLDVGLFEADELSVKVIGNGGDLDSSAEQHYVVVEGKHEEREDEHGYITRHFKRRYELPKGYDPEKVASTLSSDGVLTVSVPKPPPPQVGREQNERIVQIQSVGPSDLFVKSSTNQAKGQQKSVKHDQNEK